MLYVMTIKCCKPVLGELITNANVITRSQPASFGRASVECSSDQVARTNTMTTRFTRQEIEDRGSKEQVVFIIDNVVYDVTKFLDDHPGGHEVLVDNAGKDASECFHDVGHSDDAKEWREKFKVGEVVEEDKWEVRKKESMWTSGPQELTLSGLLSVWGTPLALAAAAYALYQYLF